MLEFEKKILLSEEEYNLLSCFFSKDTDNSNLHINYYYDTNTFDMNKKGITCRVRRKNGKLEATVKSHCGNKTECSVEISVDVNNQFQVECFEIMGLKLQGSLVTNRNEIYNDGICQAVLDCNFYLDRVDYELEIEYLQGNEKNAEQLLEEIAKVLLYGKLITSVEEFYRRTEYSKSKSERFFDCKKI